MKRSGAFILLAAIAVSTSGASAALPGGRTVCPTVLDGTTTRGSRAIDVPEQGPIGSRSSNVTGVGFSLAGDELTVSVRVEHMRREVRPGLRHAYWYASASVPQGPTTRTQVVTIRYDALLDTYSAFVGNYPSGAHQASSVEEHLGDNGGVSAIFPAGAIGADPGELLTNIRAEAGDFIQYPYGETPLAPYSGGVWSALTTFVASTDWPVIPCPGVHFTPLDRGDAQGVQMRGSTLPLVAGVPVTVEQQDEHGEWHTLASFSTIADGRFQHDVALPPGSYTLRAVVGDQSPVISPAATVTATA